MTAPSPAPTRPWLAAWLAAVLLSALGFAAWRLAGAVFPPVPLFGALTQLLGVPWVFQLVHAVFGVGQGGKTFAFLGVAVLWLGGLTVLGRFAWGAPVLGLALLLLVPWPVAVGYALGLALARLVLRRALAPLAPPSVARRGAVAALAGGGALLAGGGLLGLFRNVGAPARAADTVLPADGTLPFGVTPVENFYYVSKNLEAFDPVVDGETWRLKVGGLVNAEKGYTLDDLRRFPVRTIELTLSCISNPVGGPLMSNGIWTGLALADLLRDAGVKGGAQYLLWEAADGYTESLPLGDAFEEDVVLVYALNGRPLTPKHGFPLRVLIPGRYGMKQPRWITGITLSAVDVPGYWVKRDWSKTAHVELTSRIDLPAEQNPVVKAGEEMMVRGIAFGGLLPVTRVEVSTDGGQTWRAARLVPPRSKHAWTPWELPWTPEPGPHQLQVRAFSGTVAQKAEEKDALPEGATGYHRFIVNASS